MIPSWNCAGKNFPMPPLLNCCNNMGSRPAGRVWPNTAVSSWKAVKSANGGNGRKPRRSSISRPRLKVRQPWPQNPRRPRRAGNGHREQCPAAAKRKFSIPFTRTAHRQRENDESRGSRRIRGQPETETASELTQRRKAIRRCASIATLPGAAARAPNKQASDDRQPHAAAKVRTPPRQASNATLEASFFGWQHG